MPDAECWCFETVTGRVREVLPVSALSWNTPVDQSGQVKTTLQLGTAAARRLDLRQLTTPWRMSLAVVRGGSVCYAAGVITGGRDWDTDDPGSIEVTATDLWSILARRKLFGSYQPGPLLDVTLTSASLPGLATEIVARVTGQVPGGQLPLILPDREPGEDHTRTYKGTESKDAKTALDELSKVDGGPDIVFDPELTEGASRVQWVMRLGRPYIGAARTNLVFDHPGKGVGKLSESEDPADIASTMLVTSQPQSESDAGGEQRNLVARYDNPDLLEAGYPALWSNNGDHTDVNQQATLDGYARAYGQAAHDPVYERPLTVRADHPQLPYGTSYGRGDSGVVQVGAGQPWIRGGLYPMRIVDIATDLGPNVELTVAPDPRQG